MDAGDRRVRLSMAMIKRRRAALVCCTAVQSQGTTRTIATWASESTQCRARLMACWPAEHRSPTSRGRIASADWTTKVQLSRLVERGRDGWEASISGPAEPQKSHYSRDRVALLTHLSPRRARQASCFGFVVPVQFWSCMGSSFRSLRPGRRCTSMASGEQPRAPLILSVIGGRDCTVLISASREGDRCRIVAQATLSIHTLVPLKADCLKSSSVCPPIPGGLCAPHCAQHR